MRGNRRFLSDLFEGYGRSVPGTTGNGTMHGNWDRSPFPIYRGGNGNDLCSGVWNRRLWREWCLRRSRPSLARPVRAKRVGERRQGTEKASTVPLLESVRASDPSRFSKPNPSIIVLGNASIIVLTLTQVNDPLISPIRQVILVLSPVFWSIRACFASPDA